MGMGGAVQLDPAVPICDDQIPDGDQVPFAVTAEGSAAVRRQLLANLAGIEAHPSDRGLQAAFLERRRVLWERDDDDGLCCAR